MASKYEALTTYLSGCPEPVVVMTFSELDRLVGGLPVSAQKHQAWWANTRTAQPHAHYWLDAKRRATPDLKAGLVRFEIGAEVASAPRRRSAALPMQTKASLVSTGEVVEASVRFEWLAAGAVTLDSSSKPSFPSVPSRPGMYRFVLTDAVGATVGVYIGESDQIARRMGNYRNPGPTQPTNQRMNGRLRDVLGAGGLVELSVAFEVTVDGEAFGLDTRPARLLAENAALIRANQLGLPVENL